MTTPSSGYAADAQTALSGLLSTLDARHSIDAADISFSGEAPRFATPHKIVAAQAAAIGAVAAGVAQRWKNAHGERQGVTINALQAGCSLHPAQFQRQSGHPLPALSLARELKADFYRTADGKWFFPIGSYAHLRDGVLALLDCPNTPEALGKAIGRWKAAELEEAFAAHALPGIFARTQAEWEAHPQGRALLETPVITIEKIGDSKPEDARPQRRPLDDLRVLDLAHVIAGPVVARTFAEHGADVLRLSSPSQPDPLPQIIDTGIGKRCAFSDLRQAHDAARARELASRADVLVQSWRPGSLDKLGLGASDVARLRPGIVYVSVSAFGFDGPWGTRKGFEQLGQTASGIAITEGGEGKPRVVPTYLLNDYLTAYLGAAGALVALARRAREGGSYHVKVSLTRASMWVQSLGLQAVPQDAQTLEQLKPVLQSRLSPFGQLDQLGPVAQFTRTPAHWTLPPSNLGSSAPAWAS
jgi:crotonobetainyl-CoA:carnitine CoA-transferase CaiB-like acyl-CoA transferase